MRAYVIHKAGGPEALKLEDVAKPKIEAGKVLIKIKGIGLNRSEYFTRIGDSPSVKFPKVLGIECVGIVEESGIDRVQAGDKVAAIMGGMGRVFNGSYAEYTLVPEDCVFKLDTNLPWEKLAALTEMLQTTNGSLFSALEIERAQNILIRGGTSSIGICAAAIAKANGLRVFSTTRNQKKVDWLLKNNVDEVFIESTELAPSIRMKFPEGIDRVLELIGTTTLQDSLNCLKPGGIACMTGMLGGQWEVKNFSPMGYIPTSVKLTSYSGGNEDISEAKLNEYLKLVESGELNIPLGKVYKFERLVEAHRDMDHNTGNGKQVVILD